MTSIKTTVPEHSLRHREETIIPISGTNVCHLLTCNVASISGAADLPETSANIDATGTTGRKKAIAESSNRAWPFTAGDAPPLAWWRMLPSDLFRDAEHLLVRTTLDRLTIMKENRKWSAALRGDAAAAVGIAIKAMPIKETTLKVDIAKMAALRCALDGNTTAALVLAHVLGHAELGHPFGTELSASWHTHHLLRQRDVASPHEGGPA